MKTKKKQSDINIPTRRRMNIKEEEVGKLISDFERDGASNHTRVSGTLQYVIDYCEENEQDYIVYAHPKRKGGGYRIMKLVFETSRDWHAYIESGDAQQAGGADGATPTREGK